MRVRYGKPIKVKSLAGDQTHITKGSSYTWVGLKNNYFGNMNSGTNIICPIVSGNRYFYAIHCPTHDLSSYNPAFGQTGSQSYNAGQLVSLGNSWYGLAFTSTRNIETFNGIGIYYSWTEIFDSMTIDAYFILDLTNTDLENLTTVQLNKYNKYFPLIATGEEITIDDKAGQIPTTKLPSEYQQLEYIQNSGSQYLNLNFVPNDGAEWAYELKWMDISASGSNYVMGSRVSSSTIYFGMSGASATLSMGISNHNLSVSNYRLANRLYLNYASYFGTNEGTSKLINLTDGDSYTGTQTASLTSASASVCLFALRSGNVHSGMRVYYLKVWRNNILYRNLVPCYRKSDNVIGMYDLVGRTLYTNSGSGKFTKGNNVNDTISCKISGGSSDIYYGYNQIFTPSHYSGGYVGNGTITESVENNRIIYTYTFGSTISSTAYTNVILNISQAPISNHKYYYRISIKAPRIGRFYVRGGLSNINISEINTWTTSEKITGPWSDTNSWYVGPNNPSSQGYQEGDSYQAIINCIDLTEWFGEGKEPTTVQEFKEKFTKEYYGFCPTPIKLTRYQIEALPSYGYNQLCKNGDFSNGTTDWQRVGEGTISNDNGKMKLTISGWKAYSSVGTNSSITYIEGHKYLFRIKNIDLTNLDCSSIWTTNFELTIIAGTSNNQWVERIYNKVQPPLNINYEKILTCSSGSSWKSGNGIGVYVYGKVNSWSGYITIDSAQVIDLTDWYGAGNEPTTIEEFKATFPNKYYPYSKKTLLNKYMINKLVS